MLIVNEGIISQSSKVYVNVFVWVVWTYPSTFSTVFKQSLCPFIQANVYLISEAMWITHCVWSKRYWVLVPEWMWTLGLKYTQLTSPKWGEMHVLDYAANHHPSLRIMFVLTIKQVLSMFHWEWFYEIWRGVSLPGLPHLQRYCRC